MNRPLIYALALLQMISLSGSAAGEKSLAQHWNESGIGLDRLQFSHDCNESLTEFRRCFAGIDALARGLKPAERLIPQKLVGEKAVKQDAVVKHFSGVVLALVPAPVADAEGGASLRLKVLAAKEEVRRIDAAIGELFDSGAAVPFGAIQRELTERLKKDPALKDRLAMIAGLAENEVLQVTDAHASLQPESSVEEQRRAPDRTFFGIGVTLETVGQNTHVGRIHPGGPAHAQKKLKKNDLIVAVDGVSVVGKDSSAVADLIRSTEIKDVTLTVRRGGETVDETILRGKVETKNVETRLVNDLGASYGYLKLSSFMDERGCDKIAAGIRDLTAKGVKGFVMDVRGNGGGLLSQGLCLGGLFLGDQIVVGVKDLASERMNWLRAQPQAGQLKVKKETKLPIALLIDGGSASASEILAGALQDSRRAWIVGETSFGKATVQSLRSDAREGVRAIVGETTARFYQPSGRTNQVVGIEPDFEVPFKPGASADERFVRREGDVFLNALPPEGAVWKQPRPVTVGRIRTCLNQRKRSEALYLATATAENEIDYQLLAAQEILDCAQALKVN